jgi:hypothetical protein
MLNNRTGKARLAQRRHTTLIELSWQAEFLRHWRKIWSTNPPQPLNKEIETPAPPKEWRRINVIGIFPDAAASGLRPWPPPMASASGLRP